MQAGQKVAGTVALAYHAVPLVTLPGRLRRADFDCVAARSGRFSSMLYCRENVHFIKKKYDKVFGKPVAPCSGTSLRTQTARHVQLVTNS